MRTKPLAWRTLPRARTSRGCRCFHRIGRALELGSRAHDVRREGRRQAEAEVRELSLWSREPDHAVDELKGGMTHFQAARGALLDNDEESIGQPETRACTGCGKDFQVRRPWQLQCSPRCRQRAYVQRQIAVLNYYGA